MLSDLPPTRPLAALLLLALAGPALVPAAADATIVTTPTCAEIARLVAEWNRPDTTVDCDGNDHARDAQWEEHLALLERLDHPSLYLCVNALTCAVYDALVGNQECTASEALLDPDTDGDGRKDCQDADDDNDGAADDAEAWAFRTTSSRTRVDTDRDGIPDPLDMRARSSSPIRLALAIVEYNESSATCDIGHDRADPYLASLTFALIPGADRVVPAPAGWRQDSHIEDRETAQLNDPFELQDVSPDIRQWSLGFWELPRVEIRALLYDHDHFEYDDVIDLTPEGGVGAGRMQKPLTADENNPTGAKVILAGAEPCRAQLGLGLTDNADQREVRLAVTRWSSDTPFVTREDVERANFR